MNKQIISKTLLMTGLVILAANANAYAYKETTQCTDLRKDADDTTKSYDYDQFKAHYEGYEDSFQDPCTYCKNASTCTTYCPN